jgi:hypothetical protein
MNKFIRILSVLIFSVFVFVGCSKPMTIELQPLVKVYLSENKDKVIHLTSDDSAYNELAQWLSEHQSGWYPTSGKYPLGVYVVSGEYGIQITQRRIVIYSTKKAKPEAIYVQEIKDVELKKIKAIGK